MGTNDKIEDTNLLKSADLAEQFLVNPMAPTSLELQKTLDQLNSSLRYYQSQTHNKNSVNCIKAYEESLKRLLLVLTTSITSGFAQVSQYISAGCLNESQVIKHRLRSFISLLEERIPYSHLYKDTLKQCQENLIRERHSLVAITVTTRLEALVNSNTVNGIIDICSLMKGACAFLIHMSIDEYKLFQQFFKKNNDNFLIFLEALCINLYNRSKPLLVLVENIKTLVELCTVLKLEMMQELMQANGKLKDPNKLVQYLGEALSAFRGVADKLTRDVQTMLFVQVENYLKIDIGQFRPTFSDLSYPGKFHLIKGINIVESIEEKEFHEQKKTNLVASIALIGSITSQEIIRIHNHPAHPLYISSANEIHAIWYTPVRKTIACLNLVYSCFDVTTFKKISEDAYSICMASLKEAAKEIAVQNSALDADMFEMKHLLILREHLAPFLIDLVQNEMTFNVPYTFKGDKVLFKKKSVLLLSSNKELFDLLLNGPIDVKQQWLATQKFLDVGINDSLEAFLLHTMQTLMPDFHTFLEMTENWDKSISLKSMSWAKLSSLTKLIDKIIKTITTKLSSVQITAQLYLCDKQCELLIHNKIKDNAIKCFRKFQEILLSNNYTVNEQTQIGCQTEEQLEILFLTASHKDILSLSNV